MQQQTTKKKRLRRTWWFWVLIAVGAVVVICGGAVMADSLAYDGEIHAGITVDGVYLRGMTPDQAVAALTHLVDSAQGPVTLKSGSRTWTVTPANVGVVIDIQGAVAQAMAVTRTGDFFQDLKTRFELYRHGRDLSLKGTLDKSKLDALVSTVAANLHVTPLNALLTMRNDKVEAVPATSGQDVDTAALSARLESLFVTMHSTTVDVPLIITQAAVQEKDNEPAKQLAETMMSAPITLTSHGKAWTLSPQQIASWLDFQTEYTNGLPTLVPYISQGSMNSFLTTFAPQVYRVPVNATFTSDGTTVKVVPAVKGEALDPTATVKALNAAAVETGSRTVAVAVTPVEPSFTTADAQATTFKDQLSTFATTYVCPANRQQNVRITTKYASNVFLAPGQEYNFDRQIGPRTAARGYLLAPGITGPNTLDDVLGGGICQVSTTMFNAAFFAGLKITERHNHSIYINHYPKGRDATVTAGGKNLRFVNDTSHYIWIRGTSNGITTTISIWGTSDGRKVSYSVGNFYNVRYASTATITIQDPTLPKGQTKVSSGQVGRQLKTTRIVTMPDGTVLHNDVWISTWPAYPTTIVVGTKPTP